MLVSLSALGISILVAVSSTVQTLVLWKQTQMMRDQQRKTVVPIVGTGSSWMREEDKAQQTVAIKAGLWFRNYGLGPANVRSVRVTLDGKRVASWSELARLVQGDEAAAAAPNLSSASINQTIIPGGEQIEAFSFWGEPHATRFKERLEQLDIWVCYCSIYDECWTLDQGSLRQAVARCPEEGDQAFAN